MVILSPVVSFLSLLYFRNPGGRHACKMLIDRFDSSNANTYRTFQRNKEEGAEESGNETEKKRAIQASLFENKWRQ